MTRPFWIVIRVEDMKLFRQYWSSLSIQKLCKLLFLPTSNRLPLINRPVIHTPSLLVLSNWSLSLATSTSLIQYPNELKPFVIVATVWPLCLSKISPPAQLCGPAPDVACWQRDVSSLDVRRMQTCSEMSLFLQYSFYKISMRNAIFWCFGIIIVIRIWRIF